MLMHKKFKLVLITATLAITHTSYMALAAGGDSGAGGNTINYRLVSRYIMKNNDPAYKDLREYLKKLPRLTKDNERAFTDEVMQTLQRAKIYIIPRSLEKLPSSQTGLHFRTEQTAYQNGNEIFISEESLKKMNLNGREEFSKLLLLEALEQMIDGNGQEKMRAARDIMAVIERADDRPAGDDLMVALDRNGLRSWLSVEERERQRQHREKLAKEWRAIVMANYNESFQESCSTMNKPAGKDADEFLDQLASLIHEQNMHERELRVPLFWPQRIEAYEDLHKISVSSFASTYEALSKNQKDFLARKIAYKIFVNDRLSDRFKSNVDLEHHVNLMRKTASSLTDHLNFILGHEKAAASIKAVKQEFGLLWNSGATYEELLAREYEYTCEGVIQKLPQPVESEEPSAAAINSRGSVKRNVSSEGASAPSEKKAANSAQ